MILVSAPLRVSFFGGGSDIESYYENHGGAFLSLTIDSRIYLTVNQTTNNEVKVHYSTTELVKDASELAHPLIREALLMYNKKNNIEIGSFADMPTIGTGLGSSSTFSVALIGALKTLAGQAFSSRDLAEEACHLEINRCGERIGKQDQYAAAFGGLNFYEVDTSGRIKVSKNLVTRDIENILEDSIYLVNTGVKRSASSLLKHQIKNLKNSKSSLDNQARLVEMAYKAYNYLVEGDLDQFGQLLHESWLCKKNISGLISDNSLDDIYTEDLNAGAIGGKLLGAGGGGFFLFYVLKKNRKKFETHFQGKFRKIRISQQGFMVNYEAK
ncbi:GHMP kinase [Candidatus Marinamargulisbacteria bacterium SCGC AG-343-D04]|nr:GHMP kinase [Candidatus Marinamargulisbacteria bacterium SCGC AG-343-D04]